MSSEFLRRTGTALLSGSLSRLLSPRAAYAVGEPLLRLFGFRGEKGAFDLKTVTSALVIRLDEIGDLTLATSFIRELRRNLPRAWITLVVKPESFSLVQLCPHVDEVLAFPCRHGGRLSGLHNYAQALRLAARSLWSRHFDLAIVPRWDTDYYHAACVAYFSGARHRVGYSESVNPAKMALNHGYDRLYSLALCDHALKHEVQRNLDLLRHIGGEVRNDENEVWLDAEDLAGAAEIFCKAGVRQDECIVAIAPAGGNSRLKQWPAERFLELCHCLRRTYGTRIVLIGGPAEAELGLALEKELAGEDVVNIMGKVPLRVSVAVLKRSRVFVGNDTGLLHLAGAAGVPAIGIFGSSCPHRFGPWKRGRPVEGKVRTCGPCSSGYHKDRCQTCPFPEPVCLLDISTAEVMEAIGTAMPKSDPRAELHQPDVARAEFPREE